jgi:hypothetical protein
LQVLLQGAPLDPRHFAERVNFGSCEPAFCQRIFVEQRYMNPYKPQLILYSSNSTTAILPIHAAFGTNNINEQVTNYYYSNIKYLPRTFSVHDTINHQKDVAFQSASGLSSDCGDPSP